jgi:hypothetical protein
MADLELLKWREARGRARDDDAELADEFAARAADVRAEVTFLLGAGLSEGADESLAALAEGDMVDFCIMVDLAARVPIGGVEPLEDETRMHLEEFLAEEPWRSLAVDNDLTIALAMIEDVLNRSDATTPWYRVSPQLPVALANVMDRVNREQYVRFAGELDARLARHLDAGANLRVLHEIIVAGAHRVGARPPERLTPASR